MKHHLLNNNVVLVDAEDVEIGTMSKMEAHRRGVLHRAFSVFIFNTRGELLMQQRADSKYHSPGLWSNTCCSHPFPGEMVGDAAERRLGEEMGISIELEPVFHFIYKSPVDNGLIEHEFDYVFFGTTDIYPKINTDEVQDFKYISLEDLETDIEMFPENYTTWLKIVLGQVLDFKKNENV